MVTLNFVLKTKSGANTSTYYKYNYLSKVWCWRNLSGISVPNGYSPSLNHKQIQTTNE